MRTPVFADDPAAQRILGFLEHEDSCKQRDVFSMRCTPPKGSWPKLSDWIPHDVRYNRRDEAHLLPKIEIAHFQWNTIGTARDETGCYYCRVLITKDADKLNRVRGFVWFAEEYGQFFPAQSAGVV